MMYEIFTTIFEKNINCFVNNYNNNIVIIIVYYNK